MAGDTDEENRPNGRSDLAEDDSSQVCLYMNKYEFLPSLGIRRLSSVNFSHFNLLLETPQPNELKLGRKHLWKVLYKDC